MSDFASSADALAAIDQREQAAAQLKRANTLAIVSGGAKALGSLGVGISSFRTAQARQAIYQTNAAAIEATIPFIREQAAQKVDILQQETAQFIGAQRAALAANGIVVDQDTGLEAAVQAAGIGARDVVMALQAARQEITSTQQKAAALREEAAQEGRRGTGELISGLGGAATSILGAASTVSQANQRYRTTTGG